MSRLRVSDEHLAQCASEPIHRLGRTQDFGVLLAFDRRRRVVTASANAPAWCARPMDDLLGRAVDTLLPARSVDAAVAHARVADDRQAAQHLFGVAWPGRESAVDVTVHASGELVVIEAEPDGHGPLEPAQVLENSSRELAVGGGLAELADSAARAVARLTGYDRVMVYRFAADGSGSVIAEALSGRQVPYLGLRYPASDIPAQARELYLRNPTRLIADARHEGLPLVSLEPTPIDLSLATLRSVSPVHLEYMRNMGTAASMSISLIVNGSLWGLIACHHRRPLRPPLAVRSMSELLGRLYSLAISRVERHDLDHDIKQLLLSAPGVEGLVEPSAPPAQRGAACDAIARLLGVTGVVTHIGGQTTPWGGASVEGARAVMSALPPGDGSRVIAVESLERLQPGLARLAPQAAGVLALPLGARTGDWVLLLRDELRRHVTWAGDPAKAVDRVSGRLTPRASFAAWRESVRGHCEPWTLADLELAEVMRTRLLEVLVAHREQRELDRTRHASRQQALLVRELNHRVRNMLGLIKGLVQQTARGAQSVDDMARRLHDRVHAMSRAYTQVEKADWQPSPLTTLLTEETRAFAEPGQVHLEGEPIDLEPGTYLAFALVLHELATNARKYGALSTPDGRLRVTWQVAPEGALDLHWQESGGPPVAPPRHRGFGTRVIGQALSHQLRGRATLDFRPTGVHAHIHTPRGFVRGQALAPAATPARRHRRPPVQPRQVLVVEDDLVIAIMAETMLQHLGCRSVVVAGSQAGALEALGTQRFDFALLDVDLGDHDSGGVARELAALGVPAIVTTGYSDTDELPEALRGLPRVSKPYTEHDLERAMAEILRRWR